MRWGLPICVALVGCTNGSAPVTASKPADSGAAFASVSASAAPVSAPLESNAAPVPTLAMDAVDAHESEKGQVARNTIVITTEPPWAVVYEDGDEVCRQSPCEIVYAGRNADPVKRHKLYVSNGDLCDAEIRTVTIRDSPLHVKLKCTKPTPIWDGLEVPY
jgi:hypothetical protein